MLHSRISCSNLHAICTYMDIHKKISTWSLINPFKLKDILRIHRQEHSGVCILCILWSFSKKKHERNKGQLGVPHNYPLYRGYLWAYLGISHKDTLVGVHPTIPWKKPPVTTEPPRKQAKALANRPDIVRDDYMAELEALQAGKWMKQLPCEQWEKGSLVEMVGFL